MPRIGFLLDYDAKAAKEIDIQEPLGPGPSTALLRVAGNPSATPDANGDFLFQHNDPAAQLSFDAAHTFAVAHSTLEMFRDVFGGPIRWAWSNGQNDPLKLEVHAFPPNVSAYNRLKQRVAFSRPQSSSNPKGKLFECRSLEIVTHEVSHAVLDGLQPQWQTNALKTMPRGLHEAFADLAAMFLSLTHIELVLVAIDQNGALLPDNPFSIFGDRREKTMAEAEIRRLDNQNTIADALQKQVFFPDLGKGLDFHFASTVVSGLVYDVFRELSQRLASNSPQPADGYLEAGRLLRRIVLGAFKDASEASFAHVVGIMRDRARQVGEDSVALAFEDGGKARGILT